MGKGKHKKLLRSEKAKVKLKGASLPKGTNVTKTNFKVKKILIKEQLKNTESVDGFQQRNIKECLSHLKHTSNSSIKENSMRNIKEIISTYPDEFLSKYLGDSIQIVAQLSLEVDKDVRRESYRLLSTMFEATSLKMIEPFFNMLSSYLRCAMTHINNSIQEDSLLLLDVLLLHMSSLVARNYANIFSSFLDMISKLRTESQPGRTLTVNLGKKITAVKWRNKVLERLFKLLFALNNYKSCNNNLSTTKDTFKTIYVETDRPRYEPIIKSYLNKNYQFPFSLNKTETNVDENEDFNNGTKIKKYVELLMPLLHETWLEVRPQSTEYNKNIIMTMDVAVTLELITNIMEQLWNWIVRFDEDIKNDNMQIWFREALNTKYHELFLAGFPYNFSVHTKKINESEYFYLQNLKLCFLFCCLNKTVDDKYIYSCSNIIGFAKKCVTKMSVLNAIAFQSLTKVLRSILICNCKTWKSLIHQLRDLLKTVISFSENKSLSKGNRSTILVLLCDIALNDELFGLYGREIFTEWLQKLPAILCEKSITLHTVRTLTKLGTQNNKIFVKSLAHKLPMIIDNLSTIEVTSIDNQLRGRQMIANLFYWVESSNDLISAIENSHHLDRDINEYIQQIIKNKLAFM